MVFIYITCKDRKEASKISRHLLEKGLAGCTNSFPIQSAYWWEGKIVEEEEVVLLAKTEKSRYEEIAEEVKSIHSYTVPCICMIDSVDNDEYGHWLKRELIKKRGIASG